MGEDVRLNSSVVCNDAKILVRFRKLLNMDIYCVDVGSIKNNNFGWAKLTLENEKVESGSDIGELAESISNSLDSSVQVSIGFECPLFVPVRDEPVKVNSARKGEGNRPWSSGAGISAMGTGLVEALWIMRKVNELTKVTISATFCWETFQRKECNVFLWEAFVSGDAKGKTHIDDALIAANHFKNNIHQLESVNSISEDNALSLIGAAGLKSGWFKDLSVLSKTCLVLKTA